MSDEKLTEQIKQWAYQAEFDAVAIGPASPPPWAHFLTQWLRRGYAGRMSYLYRHIAKRLDPLEVLPGARSVISLGLSYHNSLPRPQDGSARGRVSRYAWCGDYHDLIRPRLESLAARIKERTGAQTYCCVDTGPLLERPLAAAAGLGFIGKNTVLINPRFGSWLFLAEIVTDLPLRFDEPLPDRCGRCRRCIEACPTGAIVEPYVIDASRCISYLTVELKGRIPQRFRQAIGDWIFGCDVCQQVCPHNRRPAVGTRLKADERFVDPPLRELLVLTQEQFDRRFAGGAFRRAKRRGLLRNAAIAAGNCSDPRLDEPLKRAADDPEPLVAEAARWAVEQRRKRLSRRSW